MIDYIKGEIVELSPTRMVMECSGIGYEINISLTTFTAFSGKNSGTIYVYEVIREDAHLLFGFSGKKERELFLLLISVSGVGPNTARMILSSLQTDDLIQVIASGNDAALTSVKGIGSKTAQRIMVDLKGKVKTMGSVEPSLQTGNTNVTDEAIAALIMLGFQKNASQTVVDSILKSTPNLSVEQVIKAALRML